MDFSAVTTALGRLALTRPSYVEAEAYFDGTVPEVFTSARLRELIGDASEKFRVNYARTPVDVLLERTMIQGITCKDAGQLAVLEQQWKDNELGLEAKDLHRRAYEFGDAYLIGWPDDELEGGVSFYAHDPTEVRVFYDPERPRLKQWAVQSWLELGEEGNGLGEGYWHRVNLYYPDRVEPWVSKEPIRDKDGNRLGADESGQRTEFRPYVDGDESVWPIENPVPGVIPVFHFRTGRPYGRPEHADAYGPQNGINKLTISMMAAVDYQVGPQRYATTDSSIKGTPPGDINTELFPANPLGHVTTDDTGFSPDSDMESGPGTVWLLSGQNVKVGQFDAANMQNFLDPLKWLVGAMAAVTDISIDRFDSTSKPESGESKRMAERSLNAKTSDRFALFGVTWHEVFTYGLTVFNGGETLVETDAQVAWEPPEVFSDRDSWETAKLQLEAGVPYEQVLKERGYGSDIVAQWSAQRKAAAPVEQPPSTSSATDDGPSLVS